MQLTPYSKRTWVPTGQILWATQGLTRISMGAGVAVLRAKSLPTSISLHGTKDALGRLLALRTHSHCVRAVPTLPLHACSYVPRNLRAPHSSIRRAYFLFCTYSFSWGLTTTACGLLSGSQRGKEGLQEPISSLGN